MIESICPKCGSKKVFEDDKSGRKFKCPNCEEVVLIGNINVDVSTEKEEKPDVDLKSLKIQIDIDGDTSNTLEDLNSLKEILSTANDFWVVEIGVTCFCQYSNGDPDGSGSAFEFRRWKKYNRKSKLLMEKNDITFEEAVGLTRTEILEEISKIA